VDRDLGGELRRGGISKALALETGRSALTSGLRCPAHRSPLGRLLSPYVGGPQVDGLDGMLSHVDRLQGERDRSPIDFHDAATHEPSALPARMTQTVASGHTTKRILRLAVQLCVGLSATARVETRPYSNEAQNDPSGR
jgi:hypothetical protein